MSVKRRRARVFGVLLILSLLWIPPGVATAEPVVVAQGTWSAGNGHTYLVVLDRVSTDWNDAAADVATRFPGFHLATLTSAEELDFVAELMTDVDSAGFWLGAQQHPASEPDAASGWTWVTGELWDFTNWEGGEPNDACGPASEQHLMTYITGQWNDLSTGCGHTDGYIAESYEATPGFPEPIKLLASDGAVGDDFGFSAAVSGDRVVVGAWRDDDKGSRSGSVYAFEADGAGGWAEAKLVASDGARDDFFGFSAAVSGDRVVVGALGDDDKALNSGSVYVYEPDGAGDWAETKLVASDGAAFEVFGYSVAVSGDRVVVGARQADAPWGNTGAVYVYEPDGAGDWAETKLVASDGAGSDEFGISVAVSGDRIVVGAHFDDDNGHDSGSVYVYEPDGAGDWAETKLVASDGFTFHGFGRSVAVSGDRVVVGASGDDGASGSVYVFEPDGAGGWAETKLVAPDGAPGDGFGGSVAVAGHRVVVGATGDDDNGDQSGSVYVFDLAAQPNDPPTAAAGGPYSVDEGSSVQLDGTGSTDADGTIVSYLWSPADDLDDPTLAQPTFTGVDDDVVTMTLSVTDDGGATGAATTTVTVLNVAPTVGAGADQTVDDGVTVSLDPANFSDPGTEDTHTAAIDWGDGTVDPGTVDQEAATVAGSHTYAGPGTYTVTVAVIDDEGGIGMDTLTVTVLDITPPELTVPADFEIEATAPDGATVEFEATASDDFDPDPTVVCDPASGSVFPLGDTQVVCTATDDAGNVAIAEFTVTVFLGPATFDGAIVLVEELELRAGIENSMVRKLDNAQRKFENGRLKGAIGKLTSLLAQIDAQRGKKLAEEEADMLTEAIQAMLDALTAPP